MLIQVVYYKQNCTCSNFTTCSTSFQKRKAANMKQERKKISTWFIVFIVTKRTHENGEKKKMRSRKTLRDALNPKYKDRNEKRQTFQRLSQHFDLIGDSYSFKIVMLFVCFLLWTHPIQFYFMILEKEVKAKIQILHIVFFFSSYLKSVDYFSVNNRRGYELPI